MLYIVFILFCAEYLHHLGQYEACTNYGTFKSQVLLKHACFFGWSKRREPTEVPGGHAVADCGLHDLYAEQQNR